MDRGTFLFAFTIDFQQWKVDEDRQLSTENRVEGQRGR